MTVLAPVSTYFAHFPFPSATLQACVIIPARDEAQNIAATLQALARQRDLNGAALAPGRFETLLLCNNCRDETAAIARGWARQNPRFALHIAEIALDGADANVGFARRLLMDAAQARLLSVAAHGPQAICSTDADTQVFPTWIAATLAEIAAGAEAVGGRILVAKDAETPAIRAAYLRDTAYRLYAARLEAHLDPQSADPSPRHFQFFGASLALTPRAYKQVGGLPRVPCLEDVELERALLRHDLPVRHSPHVRVLTSARAAGRVAIGLSSQLREWADLEARRDAWLVPPAAELQTKWSARRALRTLHADLLSGQHYGAEIEALSENLQLNPVCLAARLRKTAAFGALWSDVERACNANSRFRSRFAPIPVEVAIAQLRALLEGVGDK